MSDTKKRYSHAFDIAFEVESDNVGHDVTSDELIDGLRRRLSQLQASGNEEIIEACGLPYDTSDRKES